MEQFPRHQAFPSSLSSGVEEAKRERNILTRHVNFLASDALGNQRAQHAQTEATQCSLRREGLDFNIMKKIRREGKRYTLSTPIKTTSFYVKILTLDTLGFIAKHNS